MTDNLYEDLVLDHNRSPRNFGPLDGATHHGEGRNPLCGDHFHVHVRLDGDRLNEVRFDGAGCAIARASASMMTSAVTGFTKGEAALLMEAFERMLVASTGDEGLPVDESLGPLTVFENVRAYPMRIKCALLPWKALRLALGL